MINLTEEIKTILDKEQIEIINSTEKYIYVSACPRIWKDIYRCKENRKRIAGNRKLSRNYCLFFYKRSI